MICLDWTSTRTGCPGRTEFIEHHKFGVFSQSIGKTATFAVQFFLLKLVGKINEIEEPGSIRLPALMNAVEPERTACEAMAVAKWVLPVPVPPKRGFRMWRAGQCPLSRGLTATGRGGSLSSQR